jgi:hypothetical protein
MKKTGKRKPWIQIGGTDHNEKGNEDPENNPSKNNTRQSLRLTIFALRPFFVSIHRSSASPRPFLFYLSTTWFSRMATARLKMPYFDPIISKKKPNFFWPWHIAP